MFSTFHLSGVDGAEEFEGGRVEQQLFEMMLPRIVRDIESFSSARAAASSAPVQEPAERAAIDTLLDAHSYTEGGSKSSAENPSGATTRSRAVGAKKRARTDEGDVGCCPICLENREEGDGSVRMPCCSQRFHRTCVLGWFVKESDKCPTCRGVLERPSKRTRTTYSSLPIAELKKRCAERGIDATKCLEKEELCVLLDSERDKADTAQVERAARRERERGAFGGFGGFSGGIHIPIPMPLFAAQMAAASMAAAARAERNDNNNATAADAASASGAPGAASSPSARTTRSSSARATTTSSSPSSSSSSAGGAPPSPAEAAAAAAAAGLGPQPQFVRAVLESVARAVAEQGEGGHGEPTFVELSQGNGATVFGSAIAMPPLVSMMVAARMQPPSSASSSSASSTTSTHQQRRGGSRAQPPPQSSSTTTSTTTSSSATASNSGTATGGGTGSNARAARSNSRPAS